LKSAHRFDLPALFVTDGAASGPHQTSTGVLAFVTDVAVERLIPYASKATAVIR